MPSKRLDVYLKESLNISRSKAQELIDKGCVAIDGKTAAKPSEKVDENCSVDVRDTDTVLKYAGRGGYKLEKAIEHFGINIDGVCIDIGASTGGFTDCMLKNGARLVYAVDVGTNQLDERLRADKRVISMENTDIRDAHIVEADFIGCDVSFISLSKIFPYAVRLLKKEGTGVFLIKPQFEAGRENLNKKGIVKNPKIHTRVIADVINSAVSAGFNIKGLTNSPIKGGDGNIEYLLYVSRKEEKIPDREAILNVVDTAFKENR